MFKSKTLMTGLMALSLSAAAGGKSKLVFPNGGQHGEKVRISKPVKAKPNPKDSSAKNEQLIFKSGGFERKDGKLTFFLDKWGVCHYRIPHITKNAKDELIACINGRISQDGDHGHSTTFFAISKDQGKTWSYIRPSTNYQDKSRVGVKGGQFPLFKGTQDASIVQIPTTKEYFALIHEKSSGILWASLSKNLITWEKSWKVMPNSKAKYIVGGPGSATIDADGKTVIFTVHGNFPKDGGKRSANYIAWTKDGRKFKFTDEPVWDSTESSVVGLGKGKYLVQSRAKKRVLSFYDRKTKQWDNKAFPVTSHGGVEASLHRDHKTGVIYFCTPTKGRSNGVLYKSTDNGETWKEIVKLSTQGAFGYSSIVRVNRKQLGILAERNRVKKGGKPGVEYLNDIIFELIDEPMK